MSRYIHSTHSLVSVNFHSWFDVSLWFLLVSLLVLVFLMIIVRRACVRGRFMKRLKDAHSVAKRDHHLSVVLV